MVKAHETILIDGASARAAERRLAIGYASAASRPALTALFALDDILSGIRRTTRDPMVGQLRLTWWYEALVKLDSALPPAEPVLQALHADVLTRGVSGASLAAMVDGWEALLDPAPGGAAIEQFLTDRGGRLFQIAGQLLGVDDQRLSSAGAGWALAELARSLGDAAGRTMARERGMVFLDLALAGRWPVQGRPLGALALSARFDLRETTPRSGSPKRVARMALHRLTGY
ncbi:squalene/phytoene synthase family protein [Sphingomonas sp. R86520]|uniref:squalene/phytoene synthase family protein n=1 Tax=Sphingomonas sp. R86520 TaxID=3093859 RepID=UPI0036D359C1